MKRSLSTLLTTLLFAAAIVPNAMAQVQPSRFPVGLAIASAAPEQSVSNATEPTSTNIEVAPATSKSQMPTVSTIDSDKTRPSVDRPSVDRSYPGYCPALPPGTKPGDWDYREALEKCLYGT